MSLVSALVAPLSISNAIKKASRATGTDFSYLLKTAARESAFKKGAKAKTSSAAGLFQFIESTWLKTVKEAGDKFGLDKYTPHIFTTRSGRHYVPNGKLRREILQLRHNPEVSAMMAGAFTQQNAEFIASKIGRNPTQGELYIAHFLGPNGASNLISLAGSKPNSRADRHFPSAARANRPIFYSRGRPRTVKQVYNELVRDHAKQQAIAATQNLPAKKPDIIKAASAQLDTAPVAKPLVETINPVVQAVERPAALVHKTSARQVPVIEGRDMELVADGVESKVIESSSSNQALGLLGQQGSPMASSRKVAALTHNNLSIPDKTVNHVASGSIGSWTTIVLPPAEEMAGQGRTVSTTSQQDEESVRIRKRNSEQRKARARAPRLLEQSAKRNRSPAPIRFTSIFDEYGPDFWGQMTMNGG